MTAIISVDGLKVQLQTPDLDRDGKTGGVEKLMSHQGFGEQNLIQPTEIGESLRELNDDRLEAETRMSGIDLRTRLHYLELNHVLAMDALVAFGIAPTRCLGFTRQKKRLAVSLNGKGRDDIVQVVAGKRELERQAGSGGFMDKMKGMFKPQG